MVKRGEVWLVALDPTIGSEIQKTRLCLIVSPDELNRHRRTVLIAPMTNRGRPAPFKVAIRFRGTDGFALPEQLRTVDRQRLLTRRGEIKPGDLRQVLNVLQEMFALSERS